jgi:hypothetical protein
LDYRHGFRISEELHGSESPDCEENQRYIITLELHRICKTKVAVAHTPEIELLESSVSWKYILALEYLDKRCKNRCTIKACKARIQGQFNSILYIVDTV